ncbi:2499_t:CDS:2, partial [Funneliformis geosporum]
MPKFVGKEYEFQVNSELKDEHLHILVTYDKTTFQSNDRLKSDTIERLKLSDDNVDAEILSEILFAFDNFSSYAKLANESLNATNINLNPDDKQPIICDTIFNEQVQSMIFSADYPDKKLCEKPKEMK